MKNKGASGVLRGGPGAGELFPGGQRWQPVGSGRECGSPTSHSAGCGPGLILQAARGQHGGTGEGMTGSRGVKVKRHSVWDTTWLGQSLPV